MIIILLGGQFPELWPHQDSLPNSYCLLVARTHTHTQTHTHAHTLSAHKRASTHTGKHAARRIKGTHKHTHTQKHSVDYQSIWSWTKPVNETNLETQRTPILLLSVCLPLSLHSPPPAFRCLSLSQVISLSLSFSLSLSLSFSRSIFFMFLIFLTI